jgi:5'-deoxynucleotidase YfbR-like HD superfamily hydrolase
MSVFISHTSSDDPFVEKLASDLRRENIDVWVDHGKILPGDDIIRKIEEGIKGATHVVIVFSPSSILSDWVREESHAAQWRAIGGDIRLVPVLYGKFNAADMPVLLKSRAYVDFRPEESYEKSLAKLLVAFNAPRYTQGGEQIPYSESGWQSLNEADLRPPQVTRRSILEKHRASALRFIPEKNNLPSLQDIERYAELFRVILVVVEPSLVEGNILERLTDFALKQSSDLVQLQGASGTGKTVLLALLYFSALLRYERHEGNVFPFFLHLKDYDEYSEDQMLQRCQKDLAEIESVMNYSDDGHFILFVDGIDGFLEFRVKVVGKVLQLCRQSLKKIAGVSLGIDPSDHSQRFELDKSPVVKLRSLDPRNRGEVSLLVEEFLRTTKHAGDAKVCEEFRKKFDHFQFSQVDLRSMAMLMRLWERDAYQEVRDLFDLLQRYCREFLAPRASEGEYSPILRNAAALAYARLYEDTKLSSSQQRGNNSWLLAHHNLDISNYLLARHVAGCLLGTIEGGTDSVLRRIYSYPIARFAKSVLTENPRTQRKAVDASKKIASAADVIVRANVSYFLGRLTDAKREATQLLRNMLEEAKKEDDARTEVLGLLRSIYVSLIYLGDRKASEEYISKVIESPEWDHINRGFHLEYYGDIDVNRWSDYSHEDTLVEFPRTFERLYQSIHSNLRVSRYAPRELEIYTIFSLAQKRHARGELNQEIRRQLLDLVGLLLVERLDSRVLREYLRMLQVHLRKESFSVGDIFEDLYRVKEERRKGWVVRGLRDTEHIADHMYGAYLLGLFFLPEKMDDVGYCKKVVLQTVLIHDIGEAYTGDILSRDKLEEDREVESSWLEYLGMLGTYSELADTQEIAKLARAYNSKSTINGQIARDLDNLDVFVQMHLYCRQKQIEDFEDWKQEIADGLLTQEGRRILDVLQKHFKDGGGSAAGLQDLPVRHRQITSLDPIKKPPR